MKSIECEMILNTKSGYCLQPIKFKSIRAALRFAEETGMAYRIFVNGKCVKSGWRIKK